MAIRLFIFKIIGILMALALVGWIGFEIYHARYLEAVAISGVSSILLWFALGMGRKPLDEE